MMSRARLAFSFFRPLSLLDSPAAIYVTTLRVRSLPLGKYNIEIKIYRAFWNSGRQANERSCIYTLVRALRIAIVKLCARAQRCNARAARPKLNGRFTGCVYSYIYTRREKERSERERGSAELKRLYGGMRCDAY